MAKKKVWRIFNEETPGITAAWETDARNRT